MTGTEPDKGGVSTTIVSSESQVEKNNRLVKGNHGLVEEKHHLAAQSLSLGIIVSELILHEKITRDETERKIANLTSELDHAWSTVQQLSSLIDDLNAQIHRLYRLCADAVKPVQTEINNADGWGRIKPAFEHLLPIHKKGRRLILDLKVLI